MDESRRHFPDGDEDRVRLGQFCRANVVALASKQQSSANFVGRAFDVVEILCELPIRLLAEPLCDVAARRIGRVRELISQLEVSA